MHSEALRLLHMLKKYDPQTTLDKGINEKSHNNHHASDDESEEEEEVVEEKKDRYDGFDNLVNYMTRYFKRKNQQTQMIL